jgi:hypothetical protein
MIPEALRVTLQTAGERLRALGIPFAVFGGLAISHWKRFRATLDVDLLISIDNIDPDKLVDAFHSAGFRTKRQPPIIDLGDARLLQLFFEPPETYVEIRLDLMIAINEYHRGVIARRVSGSLPGINSPVDVVSCEDLILLKLNAGRVIDRADSAALVRTNRDSLDLPYLRKWIDHFNLQPQWAEIWDEAFPGESPPN